MRSQHPQSFSSVQGELDHLINSFQSFTSRHEANSHSLQAKGFNQSSVEIINQIYQRLFGIENKYKVPRR